MKTLLLLTAVIGAACSKYVGPIIQAGLDLIEFFEGFRPNFYIDPVGIKTIGYGHACHVWSCTVPLNGKYYVPLTRASAQALLIDDLTRTSLLHPLSYEGCVNNAIAYENLNANQFSALVSFTFNEGCLNLQMSTLASKLSNGDVVGAANEFPKWIYAGGKILPGLVKRRAAERALFCSGGLCGTPDSEVPGNCTGSARNVHSVRKRPSKNGKVVRLLASGEDVAVIGRTTGTKIRGNPFWFRLSDGYVPARYIDIDSNNGAPYCTADY